MTEDVDELLVQGIAERHSPPLTLEEARARLERGGEPYRKLLERGHEAFVEAVRTLNESSGDAYWSALKELEQHRVPEWLVRPVNNYWSDQYNAVSDAAWGDPDGNSRRTAAHYARMAVYEYAWPGNQDELLGSMRPLLQERTDR